MQQVTEIYGGEGGWDSLGWHGFRTMSIHTRQEICWDALRIQLHERALLFEISIKPGRNSLQALNSSVGATFSRQSVTLFGKDNKFCIHT